VWNFQQGIPVPVIPPAQRYLRRSIPYRLYNVIGELFHQEGSLWFDIHQPNDNHWRYPGHSTSFWVNLFDKETREQTFKGVWHSDQSFALHGWLRFEFGAINGQNFTDTALDYSLLIFQRMGVLEEITRYPLIGKISQQSDTPRYESSWIDIALYRFEDARARLNNKK
jgi:hypothetical protein